MSTLETLKKSRSKNIVLFGGILTLLLWFFMLEAGGTGENQIKDIRFAPHPTFSRLIFEMKKDFTYSLTPDFKNQQLLFRVPDTTIAEDFSKKKITDARIKGVTLKESKETGELLITVLLQYPQNSVYHLSLEGPPRLVLDVQKKNGAAKDSPEAVLKRKSFPELEEKPQPPVMVAEAPAETVQPVAQTEPAPPPPPPQEKAKPSPEELAQREQILQEIEKKNAGKELYVEGLKLFQQTKYSEAYLKLQEFIQGFPESPYAENASYLMADCQFYLVDEKKPEYAAAVHDFRAALRKFPLSANRDSALFKLGKMYFSMGLSLEAMASVDEILELYGKKRYGLQAKLLKANMYYSALDYKRAYDLYKDVIQLSPYSPEAKSASFSIADYLYDTHNYDQALNVYLEASKRWPTYPKTHPHIILNLGMLYYDKKEFEESRKHFFTLVNLYPDFEFSVKAMTFLGDSYFTEGKDEAAMKVFAETVVRNPGTPAANYGRMRIAEVGVDKPTYTPKKKIFDTYQAYYDPIKTFQEISKKYADDPKSVAYALLHEGVALSKKKEFFNAISIFRKIHDKFPETAQSNEVKGMIQNSFYDMVLAYYGQEGFMPLLAAYHENLDPYLKDIKNLQVLYLLADVYQKVGLYETAIKYYQRIRELDEKGEYKDAMIIQLGSIQTKKGNYEEAEKALTRFIAEFPQSKYQSQAISMLGDVFFQQKKYLEAEREYSSYIARFPKAPDKSYFSSRLGAALKKQKKFSEAIAALKDSVKLFKIADPTQPIPAFYKDNYYEIGDCYYLNGEYAKAVQSYKEAVEKFEQEPRNVYAKYFIGESYAKLKEDASAESQLKNLTESSQGAIWSKAAELSNNSMKWEKGYKEVM
jgi:TolA-binding protein